MTPLLQALLEEGSLRDPQSQRPLRLSPDGRWLISESDGRAWPILDGIPRLIAGQERPWSA